MKFRSLALLFAVAAGCGTYHLGSDGGADDMAGGGGSGGDDGGIVTTGDGGVIPQRACGTVFTYHGASPDDGQPSPASSTTGTRPPTSSPAPTRNGNWTATVMLAPGAYGYKVVTTDAGGIATWQLDPATPYTKWVGGTENSVVEVDDCKTPQLTLQGAHQDAPTARSTPRCSTSTAPTAPASTSSSVTVTLDGTAAGGASLDGNGVITVDTTGLAKTKHRLIVHAADKAGHAAVDLHVPFWIEDTPFDFRDGLLYFAFTDRFQQRRPVERHARRHRRRARQLRGRRLRRHRQRHRRRLLRRARRAHHLAVAAEHQPRPAATRAPATTCTPAITATGRRRGATCSRASATWRR